MANPTGCNCERVCQKMKKAMVHKEQGKLGNVIGVLRRLQKNIQDLERVGFDVVIPIKVTFLTGLTPLLAEREAYAVARVKEINAEYFPVRAKVIGTKDIPLC